MPEALDQDFRLFYDPLPLFSKPKQERPQPRRKPRGASQLDLFNNTSLYSPSENRLIKYGRNINGSVIFVHFDKVNGNAVNPLGWSEYTGELLDISKYVSRSRIRFLNRSFGSFASRDDRLHHLCFDLEDAGKSRIGDVIQMSEADILKLPSATVEAVEVLKEFLKPAELRLGMKIIGWPTQAPTARPER